MESKFDKYRYMGAVYPETSEFWKPAILTMLGDIDKYIRPWWMPRIILNTIYDVSHKKGKTTNWYWNQVLESLHSLAYVHQIKSKFATLRVYGLFSDRVQEIVKVAEGVCDDTCESCGARGASHVMIKGWVTNLCSTCKETNKK